MTWALAFSKDRNADIFRSDILAREKRKMLWIQIQHYIYNPFFDTRKIHGKWPTNGIAVTFIKMLGDKKKSEFHTALDSLQNMIIGRVFKIISEGIWGKILIPEKRLFIANYIDLSNIEKLQIAVFFN